ncbi:MAG: aspartate/glutamate racemase family protein [Acidobacteriota bacterium]
MRRQKTVEWLIVLFMAGFVGLGFSAVRGRRPISNEKLESLFQKRRVTIAVTDSGLGGLTVIAEAIRRLKETPVFERADFVFFNALFSAEGGYNALQTREEKVRIFNAALESLDIRFHPDLILIACNTLSVVYPDTPFSRRVKIPVIGIVEPGVELIARQLRDHPDSSVIIFGTPTTISEGTHRSALLGQGFPPARIYLQSCPELEAFIERDFAGDETGMLILGYVEEALQKIPARRPPLLVSLNCTHYGYSLPLWEKAFREAGAAPLAVLNPNARMTDALIKPERAGRHKKNEVSARVVSMVEISPEKISSLGRWLQTLSPETAEALRRYEHIPSLFKWKGLTSENSL